MDGRGSESIYKGIGRHWGLENQDRWRKLIGPGGRRAPSGRNLRIMEKYAERHLLTAVEACLQGRERAKSVRGEAASLKKALRQLDGPGETGERNIHKVEKAELPKAPRGPVPLAKSNVENLGEKRARPPKRLRDGEDGEDVEESGAKRKRRDRGLHDEAD